MNRCLFLQVLIIVGCGSAVAAPRMRDTPLEKRYSALKEYDIPIGLSYSGWRIRSFVDNFDAPPVTIRNIESRDEPQARKVIEEVKNLFSFNSTEYDRAYSCLASGTSYLKKSYHHFLLKKIVFEKPNISFIYHILQDGKFPSYLPGDPSEPFLDTSLKRNRTCNIVSAEFLPDNLKEWIEALPKFSTRLIMAESILKWVETFNYMVEYLIQRPSRSDIGEHAVPNSFFGHFLQSYHPDFLGYYAVFFGKNDLDLFPVEEREIALEGKVQFFDSCSRFFKILDAKRWPEYPMTNYVLSMYKWLLAENKKITPLLRNLLFRGRTFSFLTTLYQQMIAIHRYSFITLTDKQFLDARRKSMLLKKDDVDTELAFMQSRCGHFDRDIDPLHTFFEDYRFFYQNNFFAEVVSHIIPYLEKYILTSNRLTGSCTIFHDLRDATRAQVLAHFIEHRVLKTSEEGKYVINDQTLRILLGIYLKAFLKCMSELPGDTIKFDNVLKRMEQSSASFEACLLFCSDVLALPLKMAYFQFQYSLAVSIRSHYPRHAKMVKEFFNTMQNSTDPKVKPFISGMLFHQKFVPTASAKKEEEKAGKELVKTAAKTEEPQTSENKV